MKKHTASVPQIVLVTCYIIAASARPTPEDTGNSPNSIMAPETSDDTEALQLYSQWLQSTTGARFAPSIDTKDEGFANFKDTMARIDEINSNPDNQWTAGLNSRANFPRAKHYPLMSIPFDNVETNSNSSSTSSRQGIEYDFPPTVDWVAAGKTTPVKAQRDCGSCYAFATLAAVESKLMILGGPETDLSEQAIVNCESESFGCRGGYVSKALDFIQEKGVPLESALPYTEKQTECSAIPTSVKISGWETTARFSASSIMAAVAKSPVVFIQDVAPDFELYKNGVYSSDSCYRTGVGAGRAHAMLIVGYNTVADPPYWIVRNSWGDDWGMAGYAHIKMDPDNTPGQCSMYFYAMYYPTGASLIVDSINQTVTDRITIPPPPEIVCVGQGWDDFYIPPKDDSVIKILITKSFDSCAEATNQNTGNIFNFNKKTKTCSVMLMTPLNDVAKSLVASKHMMAGYPKCSTKKAANPSPKLPSS
jgi:hypothetical protein